MCKKAGNKERNSPCGKPAKEKAFELHTVSEIILEVVWNLMSFNHGSFSSEQALAPLPLFFFKLRTQNQRFSNRAETEGYEGGLKCIICLVF